MASDINETQVIIGGEGDDLLSGRTSLLALDSIIIGRAGDDTLQGDIANDHLLGEEGDDILQGTFLCPPWIFKAAVVRKEGNEEFDTLTGGAGADQFILGELFESDDPLFDDQEAVLYSQAGIDDYALITDFNPDEDLIQLTGEASDYSLAVFPDGFPEGTAIYLGAVEDSEVIAILSDVLIDDFSSGFNFNSISAVDVSTEV